MNNLTHENEIRLNPDQLRMQQHLQKQLEQQQQQDWLMMNVLNSSSSKVSNQQQQNPNLALGRDYQTEQSGNIVNSHVLSPSIAAAASLTDDWLKNIVKNSVFKFFIKFRI